MNNSSRLISGLTTLYNDNQPSRSFARATLFLGLPWLCWAVLLSEVLHEGAKCIDQRQERQSAAHETRRFATIAAWRRLGSHNTRDLYLDGRVFKTETS
jgi:hypothetical protein